MVDKSERNDKVKSVRQSAIASFVRARLSREEVLGLHFTIGIFVLGVVTWLFSSLADEVGEGAPLTRLDARFSDWLHVHGSPGLTRFMVAITDMHSTAGITVMAILVALLLWVKRERTRIAGFFLIVYGGMLLNLWLKSIFQRARPSFDDPILIITTFSFPSGHTMAATAFYGALAAMLMRRTKDWRLRALVIFVAGFMIALVGFSRIYLGVHYLTDVVGAMLEGAGWLTICLTSFAVVRMARQRGKKPR